MLSNKLLETLKRSETQLTAWVDVCDAVAEEFGALGTVILPLDKSLRMPWLTFSPSLQRPIEQYLREGWYERDVRERAAEIGRDRGYALDSDVGSEEDLAKLPYYKDLLRPNGIGGFIGILFDVDGIEWAASVQLPTGKFVPNADEVQKIVQIREVVQDTAERSLETLRRDWQQFYYGQTGFNRGVVALDADADIVSKSELAAKQLLRFDFGETNKPFEDHFSKQCLSRLLQPDDGVQFKPFPSIVAADGPSVLTVEFLRVPETMRLFSSETAAIAILSERSAVTNDLHSIAIEKYGLSPAEAKLMLHICDGASINEAAYAISIKIGTARQRMKAIYRKLEVQSQHQMVVEMMKARGLIDPIIGV